MVSGHQESSLSRHCALQNPVIRDIIKHSEGLGRMNHDREAVQGSDRFNHLIYRPMQFFVKGA